MKFYLILAVAVPLSAAPLTLSIGGAWSNSQVPQAPYFQPNAVWSLSFTVDSDPVLLDSGTSPQYSYFRAPVTDLVYILNGVSIPATGSSVNFYTHTMFSLCLTSNCVNQISAGGPQLFSGPYTAPTISTGTFTATSISSVFFAPGSGVPTVNNIGSGPVAITANSAISPVPEPGTWALALTGLLLVSVRARKRRRQ